MIKINLTPFEELDDPRWWIPDAIVLALSMFFIFGGIYFYASTVEAEINAKENEKINMTAEIENLQGEVSKFNDLNTKIATLDNRKNALKRITESKLIRYLPVILMENIQNLKPDKVWLTGLTFVDKKKPEGQEVLNAPPPEPVPTEGTEPVEGAVPESQPVPDLTVARKDIEFPVTIEISGAAVDNVAIAEFMLSLKATQNQAFEKSDLRTQLFFSDVGIAFSAITSERGQKEGESKEFVSFKLILSFKEKSSTQSEGKFSQFIDQFKKTGKARVN